MKKKYFIRSAEIYCGKFAFIIVIIGSKSKPGVRRFEKIKNVFI